FEGAAEAGQFWSPWLITIEALQLLGLLAAVPDVLVFGVGKPVVGVFDQVAMFEYLVADHNTVHTGDELRFIYNFYRVHLAAAAVFPTIPDPQRKVRVRVLRVLGVVEVGCAEFRVVATLSELFACVATPFQLRAAELIAIAARAVGVGDALRALA